MKRLSLTAVLFSFLFLVPAIFAQDSSDTSSQNALGGVLAGGCGCVGTVIAIAITVATIAGMWKVFVKAGKPGWGAIVPIYNIILICEITGRPAWWVVLLFIPVVNFIVLIILFIDLAKAFGKSAGYGLGLAFLGIIFFPMLGFGSAQYQGPVVTPPAS